jgi:hypothetical protein
VRMLGRVLVGGRELLKDAFSRATVCEVLESAMHMDSAKAMRAHDALVRYWPCVERLGVGILVLVARLPPSHFQQLTAGRNACYAVACGLGGRVPWRRPSGCFVGGWWGGGEGAAGCGGRRP